MGIATRTLSAAGVLAAGLIAAGCGPLLTAGIIAGVDSAGSSGGSGAPNNALTTVTGASAQGDTNGGTVTIEFSVQDAEGDPATVEVRYSSDANESSNALFAQLATGQFTDTAGGSLTPPLATSSGGTTYRFLWNTAQDLGTTLNQGSVRVQLVIGGELAFTTAFFSVDNTSSPMISIVSLPALPGGATTYADAQNTNAIPFQVTVMDADAQSVRIDVLFSTDGGATFPANNVAVGTFTDGSGATQDPTALPSTSSGSSYTFAWNSALNGVNVNSSIVLRFTAQDSKAGAPRDSSPFAVNNASFSALIDTPGPSAEVDRVEVVFVLIDEAGSTLDVLVEYSISGPNGPFYSCTQAQQPPTEGSFGLAAPISPGQEHTFLWNSFADFRARGAFTINNAVLRLTPYRRETQVFGSPVPTGTFPVDQRLIRTVFNEGLEFATNTAATTVSLPPLEDVAVSLNFLELASGEFAFLGEVNLLNGILKLFDVDDLDDVHRVGLDMNDTPYILDRAFSFGASQDISLKRIDRTTGIATELLNTQAVPFANGGQTPGDNASLVVDGNRVVVSLETTGLGQVLRSVPTLGGGAQALTYGGVVLPSGTPTPLNARAEVSALVADPGATGDLIVGLRGAAPGDATGVFTSTDSGATWTQALPALPIVDLDSDFAPVATRVIVAGSPGNGIQVSDDGGTSWTLLNNGLASPGLVSEVALLNATTFYAAFPGAVYDTTDAGLNWNLLGTFPAGAQVRDLIVLNPPWSFGGQNFTLMTATDQGVFGFASGAWQDLSNLGAGPLLSLDVRAVARDSAEDLFAATAAGVAVFDFGLGRWDPLNTGLLSLDVVSLLADPNNAGQMAVGTRDGGVFETFDGGGLWEFAGGGLSDLAATALASDQSALFVGTSNAGVFQLSGSSFLARPGDVFVGDLLFSSARLQINRLTRGPLPDTLIYSDSPGSQIVAINLSAAAVTISNVNVPAGTAVRIAGTGTEATGPSAPGVATTIDLRQPLGVASDVAGNVYFAETPYNRVWQVDAGGDATVLSGQVEAPTALALRSDDGSLYVIADSTRVERIAGGVTTRVAGDVPSVGDGLPAAVGILSRPGAVLSTPQGFLIADTEHNRVRRIDPTTGLISTFAGQGGSGTFGDGGLATAADVGAPQGLALEADGSVLIAQRAGQIRRVRPTGLIETVVGSLLPGNGGTLGTDPDGGTLLGTSMSDAFEGPNAISLQGDVLLIADVAHSKIWAANLGTAATTVAGIPLPVGEVRRVAGDAQGGDPTQATQSNYVDITGVSWLPNGGFLFTARDIGNLFAGGNVFSVNTAGSVVRLVGLFAPVFEFVSEPSGILALSDTFFVLTQSGNQTLGGVNTAAAPVNMFGQTFPQNTYTRIVGTPGIAGFAGDGGQALLGQLNLSNRPSNDWPNAAGLAVSGGTLLFPDPLNGRIRAVDGAGVLSTIAGGASPPDGDGSGAGVATLSQPLALTAVPSTGGYVVFDAGRVRHVALNTTVVSTIAGTGVFSPLDPAAPPARVQPLASTGFNFLPDKIFPNGDLVGTRMATASSTTTRIDDVAGTFDGILPGMIVQQFAPPNFTTPVRTSAVLSVTTSSLFVTPSEDGASWSSAWYQIDDAFDLLGPRGMSAVTINGTPLLAIADTRNHAVYVANLGTVPFVAQGYPGEVGGVLTIGQGEIGRVAGDGRYPLGLPETTPEDVQVGFPMDVEFLPNGVLVIADTFNGGRGRIVALNFTATPQAVAGVNVPAGGVADVVPLAAASQRPLSLAVSGQDLVWTEHGLSNTILNRFPRVRFQSNAGGMSYGVLTPAGTAVTILGGAPPYTNGVALGAARGVAVDTSGTVFVVDIAENCVYGLDPNGAPLVLAGDPGVFTLLGDSTGGSFGGAIPGSSANLRGPYGLTVDPTTGAALILDTFNFEIQRVRRFP